MEFEANSQAQFFQVPSGMLGASNESEFCFPGLMIMA